MAGNTEESELVAELGEVGKQETETVPETLNNEIEDDDEELVVQIGEEEPPPQEKEEAPQWVKELRKSHRELLRENRELKAKGPAQVVNQKPTLPERPQLSQYDYDEDKFQAAMDGWYAKKSEIDSFEENQKKQQQEEQKRRESFRTEYQEQAKTLKVKDFKEAEEEVANTLSEVQQALIIQGADQKALLIYALWKNPKRLSELAAIKDPVKFAFAAAKLEKDLKTSNRKGDKPAPETSVIRGTGPVVSSNKQLDRLRDEAAKTGDMSKVLAFKKQLRTAGK